ncbi:MAG: ribonuclease III [Syntrophaceticus sp.]|nr:ribonuclease III [Syntrophaceticus sp.]MDD3314050.1 ribonuclease III [Syntrophaceticus sp.]MDD4359583.1 ribonuclease III [Syntrophaceticus sp.]MDD4782981.1 ribonuclease III [Syntrophaceticus sp.]
MEPKLEQLEQKLNIHFKQPELLEMALIHPSYLSEHPEVKEHNQRLEFLGDAVLGAAVAYYLYEKYPESAEGDLTKARAAVVCESCLAALAHELNLGDYICLGRGEASSGGKERASILADTFEAVAAAIFLDQGWEKARGFLWPLIVERIEKTMLGVSSDFKTLLQEMVQRQGNESLSYRLLSETGPDHDKYFTSGVFLDDKMIGSGGGKSKKNSEQEAAKEAVELLKKQP